MASPVGVPCRQCGIQRPHLRPTVPSGCREIALLTTAPRVPLAPRPSLSRAHSWQVLAAKPEGAECSAALCGLGAGLVLGARPKKRPLRSWGGARHAAAGAAALVYLGGGAGAVLRYIASRLASQRGWGLAGTALVNIVGCGLLGLFTAILPGNSGAKLALGTGLCGGFTTFSTYAVEVVQLVRTGHVAQAAAYVLISNVAGFLAAAVPLWCLRAS
mmetsp:Transcript_111117/g.313511  ORF Transcript_111117/g.313511 Transcript_111117/m.313511 type:complete len:216 (+) Transcript_111117:68-715(+)